MSYVVIALNGQEIHRRELFGPVVVGRSLSCGLWLGDKTLSREHCRLEPVAEGSDGWIVVDLESRNGTFVGGRSVLRQALRDGDVIQIGAARITFHNGRYIGSRPANPTEARHESLMMQPAMAEGPEPLPGWMPRPRPTVPESRPRGNRAAVSDEDVISLPTYRPRPQPRPRVAVED